MHEDFVCNTPRRRISRQSHAFFCFIRADALNQPDGADGDEIVLVAGLGVVFLKHVTMCNKAKVLPRRHRNMMPAW